MKRRTLLAGAAAALPKWARSRAAPLRLVQDGKSAYSIVISSGASPSERRGAQELAKFLEEMSGARLPVVTDAPAAGGKLILVGRSGTLDRLGLNIPYQSFGPEGFALKTAGPHLVIAGGRLRGTMYGVYTFLEKLGCRWFTAEVSRVPRMPTIEVSELDEIQGPAFEYREPFFTEAFDKDWAARNKANGQSARLDESTGGKVQYFPFVHSFYRLIPPERYFRERPEYFSLIDGARQVERGQLCLTNPDVLRLGVERVLEWIREHPEAQILSVSQNDWEGWCECDNCRRVEQEEGGAHSGPLLRFVNALAAEIGKKHPDKLIDTLAYMYTEKPPAKARPRPNVRVRLCPIGVCEAHPYEHCKYSRYFVENLRAWAKLTRQLYVWHYNTNFSNYLLPFPDFDELAADIPLYKRHGVVGIFLEGAYPKGGGGENAELRSYVMAKQLWDPGVDVNRLVDEFIEAVYGGAARPMRAYFDLPHHEVRTPPRGRGQHIWIRRSPYLAPEVIARAQELFRQAEAGAEDDRVRKRVRKARLSLEYAELLQARTFEVRGSRYEPADLPVLKDRFARFLDGLSAFGIESIHEGRNLAADRQQLAEYLKSFPVATLESAALRVDVAPDLGGRAIRFIDRRTGQDALRRPDPGENNYPNVAGLRASLMPESHEREWPVRWEIGPASSKREVLLSGSAANGLRLRRRLWLEDGSVLRTQTAVENRATDAVQVVIGSSAEFNAGTSDDPQVAVTFRKRDGGIVDRTVVQPGMQPTGNASYIRSDRPDREWRAENRHDGFALINRFENDVVERCQVRWRGRGENLITLAIWSPQRKLEPGQTTVLETDYVLVPVASRS